MSGQNSKIGTLEAWADITIQIWRERMVMLRVWDSGDLYKSFVNNIILQSGGDQAKIDFVFSLYGIYVDMGVGKGYRQGNDGDLQFTPQRERREWFSKVWYREVMRLRELISEKFGLQYVHSMIDTLSDSFDQRYSDPVAEGKTVSNLRSVRYRKTQAARNARNYHKRRAFEGSWHNNHKTWKPIS